MNTENKQEPYSSPDIEVVEVKARLIIYQSDTGTPNLTNDDGSFGF